MKTVVVGAGIIGALTALRLAQGGAEVTVIEAGQPAAAASGASFGWINASFYHDADHFALRAAAITAHRRLGEALRSHAYQWTGCLCWEAQGPDFERQHDDLRRLGYAVEVVEPAKFAQLEPEVAKPVRALRFGQEGAVDLQVLTREALSAATALGARLVTGVQVTGFEVKGDRITGLRWSGGMIAADRVILATGTGTEHLLASVDVTLPMLDRPGLILRSHPMPPLLSHILVSPGQELRQAPNGQLIAPTAAGHQGDSTDRIDSDPAVLADAAAERVSSLLGRKVEWSEVTIAARPVPQDGLPVIGACGPRGLYVAVMHSGATLAPIVAELVACELSEGGIDAAQTALIAPYRPKRFTA